MKTIDDLDYWHTDLPVCPYCGEKQKDAEIYESGEHELECEDCGEYFDIELEYEPFFTSTKKPCKYKHNFVNARRRDCKPGEKYHKENTYESY